MRDQRSCQAPSALTTARKEQMTQQAVLMAVIDLHPVQVTVAELVRQLTRRPDDFGECDAVERAVFDLAGVGLLHRHDYRNRPDALVTPTQAAFVAHDLLLDEGGDDARIA